MKAGERRAVWLCSASALAPVLMVTLLSMQSGCGSVVETSAAAPILGATAGRRAEDCAACHPAIVDEWRSSGHARAWTDSLFQEEYRAAPAEVCVRCHAPNALPGVQAEGAVAEDGIDCATCHRRVHVGEDVVTEQNFVRRNCGTCHQFRFFTPLEFDDPRQIPYAAGWLQDTVGEWARSDAGRAGISCQQCHMPEVGGHRSHRFPGMYDRDLVADAVFVHVRAHRRGGQVIIEATISAGDIGHSFPTGDLFREAILRVWTEEAEADCAEYKLKRWFADRMEEGADGQLVTTRVELDDTRVPPPGAGPPRQIELRLRSPAARSVGWSLDLYARDLSIVRAESGVGGERLAQGVSAARRASRSCTTSVRAALARPVEGADVAAGGRTEGQTGLSGLGAPSPIVVTPVVTPVASGSVRIVAATSPRDAFPWPAGRI